MVEQQFPGPAPVEHHDAVPAAPEPDERVLEHRDRLALLAGDIEVSRAEDQGLAAAPPAPVRLVDIDRDQVEEVLDVALGAGVQGAGNRVVSRDGLTAVRPSSANSKRPSCVGLILASPGMPAPM